MFCGFSILTPWIVCVIISPFQNTFVEGCAVEFETYLNAFERALYKMAQADLGGWSLRADRRRSRQSSKFYHRLLKMHQLSVLDASVYKRRTENAENILAVRFGIGIEKGNTILEGNTNDGSTEN